MSAPSPAALRCVRSLSTLWNLGLQPGTHAEETAARLVDEETLAPEMLASLRAAAATFRHARAALLQIGKLTGQEKAMAFMAAGCDVAERSTRDLIARAEGLQP